jgi:hypothetical protein
MSRDLRAEQLREADEGAVRRLARYCGVEGWDTLTVPHLIDELACNGVVEPTWRKGCY